MEIYFGEHKIIDKEKIDLQKVQTKPRIILKEKELYTLVLIDRDAPSRENNIYKYWLHYMVVNITDDVDSGNIIMDFMPSGPPKGSGFHRYYFVLLKQNKNIDGLIIDDRKNFSLSGFIKDHDLEIIEKVMYETEKN
jgi:phosphatidylethanolamine-binding protein (PEBP) family uncharacterized protein